jgi:hypothetical protein
MSSSIGLYTSYSCAGSRLYCACHWRLPSQHDRGQSRRLRKRSGMTADIEDTFRSGLFCGSDRVAVLADTSVASALPETMSTYSVPSKALFKLAGSVKSPLDTRTHVVQNPRPSVEHGRSHQSGRRVTALEVLRRPVRRLSGCTCHKNHADSPPATREASFCFRCYKKMIPEEAHSRMGRP